MTKILIPISYWGPVSYFMQIVHSDLIVLEGYEHYPKQTYRNHCIIFGANGPQKLTVPILKGKELKVYSKDIQIDYAMPWQKIHWKAIQSAYNGSPYFQFYMDDIEKIYTKCYKFLFDLNQDCLRWLMETFHLNITISMTMEFIKIVESDLIDLRNVPYSNISDNSQFQHYRQVFEPKLGFYENLSILDLLFNNGPDSLSLL